ncbi:MAG TPA: methyltransferase domain-containing protein [Gemmatimonadaceae bacterium]|nr:methyltransferase domain-containing protein [Gemmatimonadaceae bacterium]
MTGRGAPPDHFSAVAGAYAAFRPSYPPELFEYIASIAQRRRRAWDCGAGSGQATLALAEVFDEVAASDLSGEQIALAPAHPRVGWFVAAAEAAPLADGSIDLVAVAQALHWFDHARFYDEVRRVAAPGAAIAAWSYGPPTIDGDVGAVLDRLMFETLRDDWPPGRRFVEQHYQAIPFPFERMAAPVLELAREWTVDEVIGYARSWSGTVRYIKRVGVDPVEAIEPALRGVWGRPSRRAITWPLTMLAGRVTR